MASNCANLPRVPSTAVTIEFNSGIRDHPTWNHPSTRDTCAPGSFTKKETLAFAIVESEAQSCLSVWQISDGVPSTSVIEFS